MDLVCALLLNSKVTLHTTGQHIAGFFDGVVDKISAGLRLLDWHSFVFFFRENGLDSGLSHDER
jgi:hypothetical protein